MFNHYAKLKKKKKLFNFGMECDGSNYTSRFFAIFNSWQLFVDIDMQKLHEKDFVLFYNLTWNFF